MVERETIIQKVEELVDPIALQEGLEVVEVQFAHEGGRWCLRVFIDKPGGVGLHDCETVSKHLDACLDETDLIPHFYVLEVSSPGLERPLLKEADFERFTGRLVQIKTYAPLQEKGPKKFKGLLLGINDDGVLLQVDDEELLIPWDKVARTTLALDL